MLYDSIGCGRVGLAVAALVGRDDAKARRRERGNLMPPRVPRLRPSVAQHDQRTRALLDVMHPDAVGIDELVLQVGHGAFLFSGSYTNHPAGAILIAASISRIARNIGCGAGFSSNQTLDDLERFEAKTGVEALCIALCIDDHSCASEFLSKFDRHCKGSTHQAFAHTLALGVHADCETRHPQNGDRISGQRFLNVSGKPVCLYRAGRNRHEAENLRLLDGYVGISDVMPELILPCVFLKKGIEVGIGRAK